MPTKTMYKVPPPKSWDEFQEICRDALTVRWGNLTLQINGRQGQAQHGVDIVGQNDLGYPVGVECKNYSEQISIKFIKEAIKKAEKFKPEIKIFYILTSTPRDSTLTREVSILSSKRVKDNKFALSILFWDDIYGDLIQEDKFFNKHYPQLSPPVLHPKRGNLLAAFDCGYFGMHIEKYISIIYGDIGMLAGENPNQISTLLTGVASTTYVLLSNIDPKQANDIKDLTLELENKCIDTYSGIITPAQKGWNEVDKLTLKIKGIISSMEYHLKGEELSLFLLGKRLGHWELVIDPMLKKVDSAFADLVIEGLKVAITDKESLKGATSLVKNQKGKVREEVRSIVGKIYIAVKRSLQSKS